MSPRIRDMPYAMLRSVGVRGARNSGGLTDEGLIEIPPESNVMPFPTKTSGVASAAAPL